MTPHSFGRLCACYLFIAAVSLICTGCTEDCTTYRTKLIGDVGWEKLQTSTCLSASEKKTLVDQRALYKRANLVDLLEAQSVEEGLREATIQPGDELLAEIAKASTDMSDPTHR